MNIQLEPCQGARIKSSQIANSSEKDAWDMNNLSSLKALHPQTLAKCLPFLSSLLCLPQSAALWLLKGGWKRQFLLSCLQGMGSWLFWFLRPPVSHHGEDSPLPEQWEGKVTLGSSVIEDGRLNLLQHLENSLSPQPLLRQHFFIARSICTLRKHT